MNEYLYPLSKLIARKGSSLTDKFKTSCSIVWIDDLPEPFPEQVILYTDKIPSNDLIQKADTIWFTSASLLSQYRMNHHHQTSSDFVPFAYDPTLTTALSIMHKDIDVLFYGETISDRQKNVLNTCHMKGLHVLHLKTDKIGLSLQPYWSRAKVVLSIHEEEKQIVNDLPKLMYPMANKVTVLAEMTQDTHFEKIFKNRIPIVPYDDLANTCYKLCQSISDRKEWNETAYEFITSSYKLEDFVMEALQK